MALPAETIAETNAEGGTYAPSPGGTIVRVAEAGRKETIVDTASLNAAMAQKTVIAGSGSPNGPVRLHRDDIAAIGAVILAGASAVAAGTIGAQAREALYGGY